MTINRIIILFLSLLYAYLVGSGVYGYGIDFHGLYTRPNLNMGDYQNWLGYRLSSLSYNNINFGVYLLSFLLSISASILIDQYLKYKLIRSQIFLAFIIIITFHTWPIIMSATNAMRQGFCNSLIFFGLVMLFQKKNKLALFFLFLSIFFHKTGIFFFSIIFILFFINYLMLFIKQNSKRIFLIIFTVFSITLSYYLFEIILSTEKTFRVVNGDFRIPFLIINISFIMYFIYFYQYLQENNLNLFVFIFSILAIPILLIGYNWQYERLNMMMTIPYIFSFGIIFKSRDSMILWSVMIILLLFITINQGMYSALTDEYTFKKIRGLL